jgi:hypothetical protein
MLLDGRTLIGEAMRRWPERLTVTTLTGRDCTVGYKASREFGLRVTRPTARRSPSTPKRCSREGSP